MEQTKYKVVDCKVEEVDYVKNDLDFKELVTSIAAISRGKDKSKNPEVRWNALLKEAAMGTSGRPLEYAPCILKATIYSSMVDIAPYYDLQDLDRYKVKNVELEYFLNNIMRFSHVEHIGNNEFVLTTNYRTLLNAGWNPEEIPGVPPYMLENFKVVKITAPFYIWAQLMTHTQLSKISQSDRVTGTNEYWLPNDIFKRIKNKREELSGNNIYFDRVTINVKHNDFDGLLNVLITKVSQEDAQMFFKELGYPREIWSRAIYYFKMKTFFMGGWRNDPKTWENLLLERGVLPDKWSKTWVQKETRKVAEMIRDIVMK